ncbi:MAG: glycosyltransferase family 4 protein [Ignavibacteria bacterium]|nr:glycosyltransferase family 4 protein [Ignavibacteria bacterium]
MKIAILSPAVWRTPPRKYGPWEQVAYNITEGLVEKGIDVTLFATGDSYTRAKLEYIVEKPYGENPELDAKVCECMHISYLMEKASDFDLIHNNYDFLPLTYSRLIKTPMVTTIHGFSSPKIIPVYKRYNDINYYVSISNSDRSKELNYIATVYNGVDEKQFTFREQHGNYLLFFGRIHHEKGTYECIEIAKKYGMKLIISGLIQDEKYFEEKVKPFINNKDIIYVGNSGPEERDILLGEAYALLHPINFEEPFGLSVVEAFFCGTPVIAFKRGAMPELVLDKRTGFLVNTIEEALDSLDKIKTLNRKDCREWAESKFTRNKMAEGYIEVYKKILNIN